MDYNNELSKRLEEVLLNRKWITNTNYKELLLSFNWQQATEKIGSLNTVSLLTQHINYYVKGVLNVFKGGKLEIKDKFSFNFPKVNSKENWDLVLQTFLKNAERLVFQVNKMEKNQLNQPFTNEKYGSNRRNIEAMIEHCYYHLGQISLIKKMILDNNK